MKKYGIKYRTLFDRETGRMRNVYSPVIYKNNGEEVFVSKNDEIMEFDNRKYALKQAEETYSRLKDKGEEWIR